MFFMKPKRVMSQDERDAVILALASAKDAKLRKLQERARATGNSERFVHQCREEAQNTVRLIQMVDAVSEVRSEVSVKAI